MAWGLSRKGDTEDGEVLGQTGSGERSGLFNGAC